MASLDLRALPASSEVYLCRDLGYFPVLVNPGDDEILAVVRGGAGHVGITGRLDAVRSLDGGRTWEEPIVIVDTEVDDRNPAVGIAPDGTVVLAYHAQGSYDEDGRWEGRVGRVEMKVTFSSDRGATWEDPADLGYPDLMKHSAYGRIVTLADGTMLQPLYGRCVEDPDAERDHSYILRSTDNGRTWSDVSLVASDHNETALLALPDGEILAAMRTADRGQRLCVSRSTDGGRNWGPPVEVTEGSEHPADLTLLSNGWVLMVFGVRHEPWGVQAVISKDRGHSWEGRRLIVTDDLGQNDLGYPSSVRIGDRLVTAYYCAPRKFDQPDFRGEGSFARALLYSEKGLVEALGDG